MKYFFITTIIFSAFSVSASDTNGTIDASHHTAQLCEDASCTVSTTSPINFGYFTTQSASNVHITDIELTGFVWGSSFGWVVLNCSNTTSGCSSSNGNFKVANTFSGQLSGFAWGQNTGWINFGPFANSATNPVTINSSGQFNGYAWSQNQGWIKFDCSNNDYCVQTDWRPNRPSTSGGGGGGGSNYCVLNPTDPICKPPTKPYCLTNPSDPFCMPGSLYCATYPNTPSCIKKVPVEPPKESPTESPEKSPASFCSLHLTDSTCTASSSTATFCELYPDSPTCNPPQDLCTLYPNSISCTKKVAPEQASFCATHTNDPSCMPSGRYCNLHPQDSRCSTEEFCKLHPSNLSCVTPVQIKKNLGWLTWSLLVLLVIRWLARRLRPIP